MLRTLYVTNVTRCTRDGEAYMAVLRETGGDRMLPVLMEREAAQQLMLRLQHVVRPSLPSSLTGIMYQVFNSCRIDVHQVRISAVQAGVTFCHLLFEQGGVERVVRHCRASDGLLLAYTFGCPICIDEELLERQYMRQAGEDSYSMPVNSVSNEALKSALEQAVREENYELASQLRDELERRK